VFFVNWFRKDVNGRWLWPGFGENSRVLKWICERVEGRAPAQETAIGNLPTPEALDLEGLNVSPENIKALATVDHEGWKKEVADIENYYAKFGSRLPDALRKQLEGLKRRLQ
jgi:phosphoenolpyruvate carboxykinase (GTP)